MSNIYSTKDEGFSFSKKKESNLYRGTNNDFDFKKSGSTGVYAPSRNSFDFKRSGPTVDRDQPYPSRARKAAGGAVTQPTMPQGPRQASPLGDARNFGNLPFKPVQ